MDPGSGAGMTGEGGEGYGMRRVRGQVLDSSRGRGMTVVQPWLWKRSHVLQCMRREGMDPGSGAGMTGGGGVVGIHAPQECRKGAGIFSSKRTFIRRSV